jgi:hypothetical protein
MPEAASDNLILAHFNLTLAHFNLILAIFQLNFCAFQFNSCAFLSLDLLLHKVETLGVLLHGTLVLILLLLHLTSPALRLALWPSSGRHSRLFFLDPLPGTTVG